MVAKKTGRGMGAGPSPSSTSPKETETIGGYTPEGGAGGGFLTRTQRNQAAFIKGITARCGCKDIENCRDCAMHEMTSQMLASDSGVGRSEY